MELVWMVPVAGLAAVLFALWLASDVLRRETGTPAMQEIGGMIFEGAMAFLSRQYRTIAIFAVLTAVADRRRRRRDLRGREGDRPSRTARIAYGDEQVSPTTGRGLLTGIAFLVGAFCSGLAGYIGMYIAVRSNVRTAAAAQNSLKDAITVVAARRRRLRLPRRRAEPARRLRHLLHLQRRPRLTRTTIAPFLIVGFGFGASFVALFAQLGGGIYTKAADVGADLVGKVEAGIPEDDPRNAAVVADLVGDNVGDCAGRGADLFESMSAENIGAMILGVAIYAVTGDIEWIIFPLVLRSFGIIATIVGLLSVPFFAKDDGSRTR